MPLKFLTAEERRAKREAGGDLSKDGLISVTLGKPKIVSEGGRTVRFVFSDGSIDRMGDTINPNGWELADYRRNPQILWAHNSQVPGVGRASNVGPVKDRLLGDVEFMGPEISPFADMIFRMVTGGWLRAISVGFRPLKYSFVEDSDRPWGIDFERQELLEASICPIPANPNCLIDAKSAGIDVAPLREWAERILDQGGSVTIPRKRVEATLRAAQALVASRRSPRRTREDAPAQIKSAFDTEIDNQIRRARVLRAAAIQRDVKLLLKGSP